MPEAAVIHDVDDCGTAFATNTFPQVLEIGPRPSIALLDGAEGDPKDDEMPVPDLTGHLLDAANGICWEAMSISGGTTHVHLLVAHTPTTTSFAECTKSPMTIDAHVTSTPIGSTLNLRNWLHACGSTNGVWMVALVALVTAQVFTVLGRFLEWMM